MRGDFILANFSPHVNQFDIWSTIIARILVGWEQHTTGGKLSNRQTLLSSCKKRNAVKNLTGDVLIVPLERKIATEIVDLHAAALLELPLEKLDGQRVLDPLLDHPLQRPGAVGRVVTFRRDFVY